MNKKEVVEFANMKKDIEYIKISQDELKEAFDKFIDSADDKYASKSIEKAFYWGAAIVGTALIGAFLRLIIIG